MIHVDPATVYNVLMDEAAKHEERYQIAFSKVQKDFEEYKAMPWYKRMWYDCPRGYHLLFELSSEEFQAKHRNLIRICEHAILANHKTIYLPLEYGWILGKAK